MIGVLLWAATASGAGIEYLGKFGPPTFETGTTLLDKCAGRTEEDKVACLNYIAGVADIISRSGIPQHPPLICTEETQTKGEIAVQVRDFMVAHPADLKGSAADIVVMVLNRAYPCAK